MLKSFALNLNRVEVKYDIFNDIYHHYLNYNIYFKLI